MHILRYPSPNLCHLYIKHADLFWSRVKSWSSIVIYWNYRQDCCGLQQSCDFIVTLQVIYLRVRIIFFGVCRLCCGIYWTNISRVSQKDGSKMACLMDGILCKATVPYINIFISLKCAWMLSLQLFLICHWISSHSKFEKKIQKNMLKCI